MFNQPSINDLVYSLVASKKPWISYTLYKNEYDKLSDEDKRKCINIENKANQVYSALTQPGVSELFIHKCDIRDVESWIESGPESPDTKYLSVSIGGAEHRVREHQPYICFIGASTIADLFMSDDPMKFVVEEVYQRMDSIAIEQVRYMYGVYHIEIDHRYEGHGFVLYMTQEYITLYNSYGGHVGFFISKFYRDEWLDLFLSFNSMTAQEQAINYHRIWGFREDMVTRVRKLILEDGKTDIFLIKCAKIY